MGCLTLRSSGARQLCAFAFYKDIDRRGEEFIPNQGIRNAVHYSKRRAIIGSALAARLAGR